MNPSILAAGAALSLLAGAAAAQLDGGNPPPTTILCLDVGGENRPATCRVPGSRLDRSEDICQCLRGGVPVTTPVCGPRDRPPPESAAYERARGEAARDGSLVGDTWQGRPMCAAPREPAYGR